MMRHFLRDDDITQQERLSILELAAALRSDRHLHRPFEGPKTVALLFDKPSTRTRVSFSVGVSDLGGVPMVLETSSTQMGRGESVADTTRVLSRQVETIVWRTYAQKDIEEMAGASSVPVINSLTNEFHPCQLLADLLTIKDNFGDIEGRTVAYFGDIANNVACSYLLAGASSGMNVRLSGPHRVKPPKSVWERAQQLAQESGGSVEIFDDPKAAAYGADVLTTDTWSSMGTGPVSREHKTEYRRFTLDQSLVDAASGDAIVLHCLPAYRDKEITSDVIDGPKSRVWDQAENRLHAQKALLVWLAQQRVGVS